MDKTNSVERLTRELDVITEVSKTLVSALPLTDLLNQVMDRIAELLEPAEFGVVILWDATTNVFRPAAICGEGLHDLDSLHKMVLEPGEFITGRTFDDATEHLLRTPAKITSMRANMRPSNQSHLQSALGSNEEIQSSIATPLIVGKRKYGVLILASLLTTPSPAFSSKDVPIVQSLADLIALAIHRSSLEDEALEGKQVEEASKLRAEALATLSHELRTPLAAIKGYSTALMLEEIDWPAEKRQEFLKLVDEETDNLQSMISDILDSSLIDIGQLSLEIQPIRLNRLVEEICDEMGRKSKTHRLIVDFPSDFPIVEADPYRLKQVLRNILDNAIKYSPEGLLIVTRGEMREEDVVITISDQGVGISPEDLIPLFEKYFRVKSPTGEHVPGTGLGLPVARAFVEAHGGRIWAESKVGEGTSLSFSLPLSRSLDIEESRPKEKLA